MHTHAAGAVIYLALLSPVMCAATLGVCAVLWSITIVYGNYARRTQRVLQDTLAAGNQVRVRVLHGKLLRLTHHARGCRAAGA